MRKMTALSYSLAHVCAFIYHNTALTCTNPTYMLRQFFGWTYIMANNLVHGTLVLLVQQQTGA